MRLTITSFGHLIWAASPSAALDRVGGGEPADERELRRSGGPAAGASSDGAEDRRARRGLPARARAGRGPAVCSSQTATAPSGASASSSELRRLARARGRRTAARSVREERSTARRARATLGHVGLRAETRSFSALDADRADLVLRRADQRVADVVREPVHLRLREVERHPDEAGVDAVADRRARLELAAPRDEPHPVALRDPERDRVLRVDLDERLLLLVE